MNKLLRWGLAGVVGGLLLVELGARLLFTGPLYGADAEVGYWVKPGQSGTFMLDRDWHFNAEGLGVAEPFAPSDKPDILLVGDSLVFGGNELAQRDRLGPALEARTGFEVWPMSAGSWAIQNEIAMLNRKPHLVAGADAIVWVVNSRDFGEPSVWHSDARHPRARPKLYLTYVYEKVRARLGPEPEPADETPSEETLAKWRAFASRLDKPLIVIAYSDQLQTGSQCAWAPPPFRRYGRWYCYDGVARGGRGLFRDIIHPTPGGNRALANFIATTLRQEAM